MRDILIVTKFTLIEALKKKALIISTIIMILLIIGTSVITKYIPKIMDKNKILIADNDNVFENQLDELNKIGLNSKFIISKNKITLSEIKNKIKNKEIDKGILIYNQDKKIKIDYITENSALITNSPIEIQKALTEIYSKNQIKKLGLTEKQIQLLNPNFEYDIISSQEKDANKNYTITIILSALLFTAIVTFAYQVATSITTEKTSKIIETLVTYTNPKNIVIGKTLGIGLVGLIQMFTISLISIISINIFVDKNIITSMIDISTITPALGGIILIYFMLGYIEYAFLYALTGSFVNNPEDVKSSSSSVAMIAVIGFYLAYFSMMNPTSNINYISSIIPFSSPFSSPFRVMMGVASPREIIMSILILLITNLIIAHITIKVYTNAIINNGTKLSLKEIIKMYKTK